MGKGKGVEVRPSNGGPSSVTVEWPDQFDLSELEGEVDTRLWEVAEMVAEEARATTAFHDITGALRDSIRVEKSGKKYLVRAGALPGAHQAHLVEHGHVQTTAKGEVIGFTPAHPFLRPALEKVMAQFGLKDDTEQ